MLTSILSSRLKSPVILDYGIACVTPALAAVLDVTLNRLWGIDPSALLFLCGIMIVAWISGPRPALLATGLTLLAFDYFLMQPIYSFALEFREFPQLALFTATALLVVSLSAAQRRATTSLQRVRNEQQETLQELRELNGSLRIENSERRRAEENTRRTEQELRLIVDNIPVVAARYRPDGSMDFRNKAWRDYTGLSQDNVEGHRWGSALHPDDLPLIEREWRAHIATGEAFELEQRLRRADGEYRWHWVRRVPLRDDNGDVIKWYGVGFDIEDRRLAEEAQRRSEAALIEARRELQTTIDSIPVMVSTFDADGTRNFVNQQWQDYTGHSQREATGKGLNTSVYYHPDDVERFDAAWHAAQAKGETLSVDVRTRRSDGVYRWYTMRRAPQRDEQGNVVKWYSVGIDVEDQKVAENALAGAERELRLTLDSIPALASRARADGFVDYLNKRWLDYTGLTLEQGQGWNWQVAVHPDDRPHLHKAWLKMLATRKPDEVEARMRRFDGTYRWFLFRTEPLRDESGAVIGWYGTNTDIEDHKQAQNALQRSEAYSAEAQKLSQTGSLAWDISSDQHFWSDETYQIMGFDRDTKPSMDLIMQRVHPDDRARLQMEAYRTARGVGNLDYEQRLLMPDGQIKHLHVRAHRVRYASGEEEIVGALMDVTAARKSQEALHAAQTALAHASRVATLGEISATIAHEVNQPLGAIVANGQACLRFLHRETPDLNDVRGAIEWIVKDGNRAGEVIRRVRGLVKKADTYKLPVDINDLINEVVALLQSELSAKRVTLQLALTAAIPQVVADRVQLQQVVINLVMNGIDAMQTVKDRPHALLIRSYSNEPGQVVVAVSDSGIGIPDENTGRVFEAFFSTKPGGLGMGLSICRSIIEDHGGRLWSTDDRKEPGATFQFALPTPKT
jgi:PAS domain S-box-containing protein